MTATDNHRNPRIGLLSFAAMAACLVGAGLSAYLVWVHWSVKAGGAVGGLCNLNAKVNCNVAAGSAYSEVGGVPIAVLGLGFYLATLAVLVASHTRDPAQGGRIMIALYAAACAYSLFLAGVSAFILGSFCWACTGTYVVNIALLLLGRGLSGVPYLVALRRVITQPAEVMRTASPMAFLITFVLVVAGAQLGGGPLQAALAPSEAQLRGEAGKWVQKEYLAQPQMDAALWARLSAGFSKGPDNACVTLVEFSDFQCPHCARIVPNIHRLLSTYPETLRVVFRNNPLGQACNPRITRRFHPRACAAAKASVCAHEQGAFWKMHDILFANQQKLADADIRAYATQLGLGADELLTCMKSPAASKVIKVDLQDAVDAGVTGTPSLFVNGRRLPRGGTAYPKMAAVIEREIRNCQDGRN